ncbi:MULTISPECIES: hypothetical protein [unclassified Xanthomonas]|uniref:hypothetical protein n=1 Tax=unclassified Xanthomonas TaxID=2643310 RepID=UPI00288B1871|nr:MULTISPECIES: hypothetical protein [unclassified Xanthomonas]
MVSEVLHYLWDPIGIAGVVEARDEYDGYVLGICTLLWQGADHVLIGKTLIDIADEQLGLPGSEAQAERAALKLILWRDAITR